jgi:hypothetical protein
MLGNMNVSAKDSKRLTKSPMNRKSARGDEDVEAEDEPPRDEAAREENMCPRPAACPSPPSCIGVTSICSSARPLGKKCGFSCLRRRRCVVESKAFMLTRPVATD